MEHAKYEIHPAANLLPEMDADSFEQLKDDIRRHGVREAIVIFQGRLLDGRHRYRAMQELGIDPGNHAAELEECEDPISFVLSHNLHRRHLTASQRATIAAATATMRQGRPAEKVQNCTIADAAAVLNVSPRSVKSARKVAERGAPELLDAVKRGELSVSAAEAVVDATANHDEQRAVVAQGKSPRKPKRAPAAEDHASQVASDSHGAAPVAEKRDEKPEFTCRNCGEHRREQDEDGAFCAKCKDPVEDSGNADFNLLVSSVQEAKRLLRKAAKLIKAIPTTGPGRSHSPKARTAIDRAMEAVDCAYSSVSRWQSMREGSKD